MSFSKAKISRFNDGISCAPPPGTYNPEISNKNVGPIIYKTERFASNCGNGDSKQGSQFLYSSSESLSSLSDKGESTLNGYGPFKTPRLPFSSLKSLSNSVSKRKVYFVNGKSVSSENMNRTGIDSTPTLRSNSLRYGLDIIQDELVLEKNRTEKLIEEVSRIKKENESCEQFTDSMTELVFEKERLVDVLREKYDALWSLVANDSSSHHQHVFLVYDMLKNHIMKDYSDMDASYIDLIDGYERILADYEHDLDAMYTFLNELVRSQKELEYEELSKPDEKVINQLIDEVKEAEKQIRKYEWSVRNMERVMTVLKERVAESDEEVIQKYNELRILHESNARLTNELKEKDTLVASLRNVHQSLAHTLVNEVQVKERDLLQMVDEFKEKVLFEKNDLELALASERVTVQAVKADLNAKELALQEALDRIETMKCKEDNLLEQLARLRDESSVERVQLEADLCECQDRLEQWTKYRPEQSQFVYRNDDTFASFVNQMTYFINEKLPVKTQANNGHENSLYHIQNVVAENLRNRCDDENAGWIDEFLKMACDAFYKLAAENAHLREELGRSRNDFVEKCDECAQITRLLHVVENRNDQEQVAQSDEMKYVANGHSNDESNEAKYVANGHSNGHSNGFHVEEFPLEDDESALAKRVAELERLLDAERKKNESLAMENSKLERLVGPYRENLVMYESESTNNESVDENLQLIQKYTQIMDEKHQSLCLQQILDLSNNASDLKKPNDKSTKRAKTAATATKKNSNGGKENNQYAKKKESKNTKDVVKDKLGKNVVVGEVKPNHEAKVLLTSPKVNRL